MTLLAPLTPAAGIRPMTGTIGAVVDGIDLSRPLGPIERELIDRAVTEHQVVFFRDQCLSAAEQHDLAAHFGELTVHPVDRVAGTPKGVTTITDDITHPPAEFDWHTDLSWTPKPPRWGFLHAVEVPATGGDTLWASGFAMYDRLDRRTQAWCDELTAIHRPGRDLVATVRRHRGDAVAAELLRRYPPVGHPLVRRHPVSGRPALFLSPLYTCHIDGLVSYDSSALFDELHRMIDDPAVQVRWQWRQGDVAIWDERSTCHRALGDHYPQTRIMRRCTID
jgi:taurine dioxygenase